MKKTNIILILIYCCTSNLVAQQYLQSNEFLDAAFKNYNSIGLDEEHDTTIQVLYERKLNLGLNDRILVEHHLAVHADNPNHLLLSGMYVGRKDSSDYKDFSIVSKDNGKTWSHLKIFSEPEGADP